MEYPSIINIKDKCTACGACKNICPKGCIELEYDNEGFLMPEVKIELCIHCGLCEKSCHIFDENSSKKESCCSAYAGWTTERDMRNASSSGGFFSLLADVILEKGGVVFGAAYNYELKRLEQTSTQRCDISALRKSKYIESNTLDSFKQVDQLLKDGKSVLYCGTPCHISGLKRYLSLKKRDVSNLTLVDFICHGVPSNLLHSQWLKHLELKKMKGKITQIDFRSKSRGWMSFSLAYASDNEKKIDIPYYYDYYYNLFRYSSALRKSCYSCSMIDYHKSDITLADFWGRRGVIEDDNKGISLAVINSPKGDAIFQAATAKSHVVTQKLLPNQFEYAYKKRTEEEFSLSERQQTFQLIQELGLVNALEKMYGEKIMKLKIKNFIKKIIGWKR